MKAKELKKLSPKEVISKIGPLCTADQKKTGMLACVTLAQFILESGWGKSELAQNANNCFGMKQKLSGNTWKGSTWDKKSIYKVKSFEYYNGVKYLILSAFRKYPTIEASIGDHSAYLIGAMDGNKKRYSGIKGNTDYRDVISIIAKGGYATSPSYKNQIIELIKEYDLTKYNAKESSKENNITEKKENDKMKINVHAGHTKQSGKSPGAGSARTGVYESVEDRKIKDEVIRLLKERGHTVYDCTSEGSTMRDNLQRICAKCNDHKVDLDVSIHLNCFNGSGHGTETWIYSSSSKAKSYAQKITKNLASLGFTNRGVKVTQNLYFLNHTNAPALLIETFFCDNTTDCNIYKKKGYKEIALQIAKGIDSKVGTKKEENKKPSTPAQNTSTGKKAYTGKLPSKTVGPNMGTKADIKLWQKALNWFGPDVIVDGIWGEDTDAKTIACQKKLGVEPDRYVGAKTIAAFKKYKK